VRVTNPGDTSPGKPVAPSEANEGGYPGSLLPDWDRLLTAGDLADLLAVPESWVRDHTRSGLIPHVPLGRYIRYRREAVLGITKQTAWQRFSGEMRHPITGEEIERRDN
jgi:hypothetical protein